MVAWNMEIISNEMMKPSIPTPPNLINHSLSLLDQIAPSHYFPLIFFYKSNQISNNINILDHQAQISQKLKSSFSVTLSRFYPLAGRINIQNNFSIDCNDAGASYIEAQVHSHLSEAMQQGKTEDLHRFLPINPRGDAGEVLLAVQINFFDCGGIAIGVCMSHKIADGTSFVMFMTSWAAISSGNINGDHDNSVVIHPDFNMNSLHFPPQNIPFRRGANRPNPGAKDEKFITKRLVFDREKLAKLKKDMISGVNEKATSTRVEAVTSFLWKRFIDVGQKTDPKISPKKHYVALHALNLRPRMNPPLPEQTFGNIWRFLLAISDQNAKEYHDLLVQLRNGIAKVNDECRTWEKNMGSVMKSMEFFSKGEEMEICTFSSWCRFPIYGVDFGFGKPVWVCTTAIPFRNAVILMPTRNGGGIEAWVNMVEDDFEMLKNDEEFTSLLVHA